MSCRLTAGVQRGTGDSVSERTLASVVHMGPGRQPGAVCWGTRWLLKHPQNRSRLLRLTFASSFVKAAMNKPMQKEMH